MQKQFTIAGAGIAGLTAAIALRRQGIDPIIVEAAPVLKPVGAGLGLAANAIRALALLGIEKGIIEKGQFLDGLSFRTDKDALLMHADTSRVSRAYGQDNFVIHRADLHEQLLSHLDPSRIVTGKPLAAVVPRGDGVLLRFQDGSEQRTDYLIAADGIHSAVRRSILPHVRPRYAGYTCWRCIVPQSAIPAKGVEEILGPAGRFGIVPLPGGRVYWFACVNAPEGDLRMKAMTAAGLGRIFAGYPPRVGGLLKASEGLPLIWGDIADLPSGHAYHHGHIVLIGDAAHATTPNMGQGACQAIEDAVVLAAELGRHASPVSAFKAFEARRLERTRMIVDRSRMLGRMAQWRHPGLILLRNMIFRATPSAVFRRQLQKLYAVDLS